MSQDVHSVQAEQTYQLANKKSNVPQKKLIMNKWIWSNIEMAQWYILTTQFLGNNSIFHAKSHSFGQHRLLEWQYPEWNVSPKAKSKSAAMHRNCSKLSFPCGSSAEVDIYQGTHKKSSARCRLQDNREKTEWPGLAKRWGTSRQSWCG